MWMVETTQRDRASEAFLHDHMTTSIISKSKPPDMGKFLKLVRICLVIIIVAKWTIRIAVYVEPDAPDDGTTTEPAGDDRRARPPPSSSVDQNVNDNKVITITSDTTTIRDTLCSKAIQRMHELKNQSTTIKERSKGLLFLLEKGVILTVAAAISNKLDNNYYLSARGNATGSPLFSIVGQHAPTMKSAVYHFQPGSWVQKFCGRQMY